MANVKKGKRGLGRGLSALMADVATQSPEGTQTPMDPTGSRVLPIENIQPNPDQPRRTFGRENLEELAQSIREKGVLQPLLVRKNNAKSNSYEIIAGERRWRAAQIAQLHELPVLVRDYSDQEVLEIAIIENVQRADLNPVEEATGYRQLMDRFGHTQEKVAQALSKSRSHIANLLRMLNLPEEVLNLVKEGKLSAGHARALVTAENPLEIAKRIISNGLSVRETEKLVKTPNDSKKPRVKKVTAKDADTVALEKDLAASLKMKVVVDHRNKDGAGTVTINYKDMDQLDQICQRLSLVL